MGWGWESDRGAPFLFARFEAQGKGETYGMIAGCWRFVNYFR